LGRPGGRADIFLKKFRTGVLGAGFSLSEFISDLLGQDVRDSADDAHADGDTAGPGGKACKETRLARGINPRLEICLVDISLQARLDGVERVGDGGGDDAGRAAARKAVEPLIVALERVAHQVDKLRADAQKACCEATVSQHGELSALVGSKHSPCLADLLKRVHETEAAPLLVHNNHLRRP
jgi:hypothetical protein